MSYFHQLKQIFKKLNELSAEGPELDIEFVIKLLISIYSQDFIELTYFLPFLNINDYILITRSIRKNDPDEQNFILSPAGDAIKYQNWDESLATSIFNRSIYIEPYSNHPVLPKHHFKGSSQYALLVFTSPAAALEARRIAAESKAAYALPMIVWISRMVEYKQIRELYPQNQTWDPVKFSSIKTNCVAASVVGIFSGTGPKVLKRLLSLVSRVIYVDYDAVGITNNDDDADNAAENVVVWFEDDVGAKRAEKYYGRVKIAHRGPGDTVGQLMGVEEQGDEIFIGIRVLEGGEKKRYWRGVKAKENESDAEGDNNENACVILDAEAGEEVDLKHRRRKKRKAEHIHFD